MRTSGSAAVVVAVAAIVTGAARAGGGGPGAVYNDYAQDGKLSCNHSRADLEGALRSGTLNQYGDPYTLTGLKLAIRRNLAVGCRRTRSGGGGATGAESTPGQTGGPVAGHKSKPKSPGKPNSPRKPGNPKLQPPAPPSGGSNQASVGGSSGSFLAGRGLILLGLVAAVILAGWLTKHALTARD
jgi:hypothetical protein